MSIDTFIKMNDWKLKNFLILVFSVQLAMWGSIGLDLLNYHIPIIRQMIGFVYLTYIPGIILIRTLKIHKIGTVEVLLYSVGASIAVTMFSLASLNFISTAFGIPAPISLMPVTTVLSIVVLAMSFICYLVDKPLSDHGGTGSENTHKDLPWIYVFVLSIIPLICIVGAYLVNYYDNNLLLMFLIVVISLVIFVFTLKSKKLSGLYPFTIFVISFSLLFHTSLISMYLHSWDIHLEYYMANSVLIDNWWDPNVFSPLNSMLSIVILAPLYSIMLNLDLTWVFKIVYPLIFSLVPVGLYKAYLKQTHEVVAFLSCVFFISLFTFYTEMLALARQQIAELFFVLLILLIISNEIALKKRAILVAIFSASLIVSHYGISYIYLFYIVAIWSIDRLRYGLSYFTGRLRSMNAGTFEKANMINIYYIGFVVAFMLIWYSYTSQSSALYNFISVLNTIIKYALVDILDPSTSQGLNLILTSKLSLIHSIAKYLHLLSQAFIALGLIVTTFKIIKIDFHSQYITMLFISFLFCIFGIVVPFFASSLNATRLYQIVLIVLSPFCIIGVIAFLNKLVNLMTHTGTALKIKAIASLFVIIFLLFNVGFIYELLNDGPTSTSLSQQNLIKYGDIKSKSEILYNEINTYDQDIRSITWCQSTLMLELHDFYTDLNTCHPCISYGMILSPKVIPQNVSTISPGSYLFFGYPSVTDNLVRENLSVTYKMTDISPFLFESDKIYDNGAGEVYIAG